LSALDTRTKFLEDFLTAEKSRRRIAGSINFSPQMHYAWVYNYFSPHTVQKSVGELFRYLKKRIAG
jgi:hypothetical protein